MNKNELIILLRDPSKISSSDLEEIAELVRESPYFLSARLLLAKGSKELKQPNTKNRIASAAVYSTDRTLLKKYMNGDLFFLNRPSLAKKNVRKKIVTKNEIEGKSTNKSEDAISDTSLNKQPGVLKTTRKRPGPKVPNIPSGDLDAILEELRQDMENLKSSRAHFVEVQHQIEEDEVTHRKAGVNDKIDIVELKKDIEKEIVGSDESKPPKPKKIKAKEEQSEIDEDEAINRKLTELAKQQEELAIKVEQKIALEKENRTKEKAIKKEQKEIESNRIEGIILNNKTEKKSTLSSDNGIEKHSERTTREPKFSRFSNRSYIRKPKVPKDDFIEFDKENETKDNKISLEESMEQTKSEKRKILKAKRTDYKNKPEASLKDHGIEKSDQSTTKQETTKPYTSDITMSKNTIVKKAKLVKSKRSTRQGSKMGKSSEPELFNNKDEDLAKYKHKKQQRIIDKFIKESPSLKYNREFKQTTDDLAANSASWDKNTASEYLAEIYLEQGNKKRAIEIYKVLSLKYPEKKSYFVSLISKIE
ncbi:MAG: hypothetical protein AAF620_10485 [Bacteroidota bacterium]